jgi:diadenosine tetraphosphate (Ap4A) HIT family hydrolase
MPIDATKPYDPGNVFARILRGELPCSKVYEDEHALAFHDLNPQAPVHILVIPKGAYVSWDDFSDRASAEELAGLRPRRSARCPATSGWSPRLSRPCQYRPLAGQEVGHLHVHIFGGQPLGRCWRGTDHAEAAIAALCSARAGCTRPSAPKPIVMGEFTHCSRACSGSAERLAVRLPRVCRKIRGALPWSM